jgi:uncharacterized RDD family membrane protein YckC
MPKVEPYLPSHMTDQEIMSHWKKENQGPLSERNLAGYPNASCTARFFAHLIDAMFIGFAFGLSMVAVFAAAQLDLFEMNKEEPAPLAFAIVGGIVFIGFVIQWILITTRGQTVGKFLTCIRVVTVGGRLPGFVVGVVIRNWLRVLLGLIPFVGLIDILFIFGEDKRCLHDYIAGTRVVQAM